ncbi:phosphomannomutase [Thioclava sp. SK-1]|uniref:phosphomannomutase n=1 Tax=Thioclava sp. SK-1 TaxID=1889770 RepID=UPI000824E7C1|nr:phosphomannomutase [Thioclava sp. SK-1]OCX66431.1 phosphomannomutase [Thioclava sp. SK-1]
MPPKFGTSGLRGLVVDLTPVLITDYVRAFIAACPQGRCVYVGRDLRPSSPDIAAVVIAAIQDAGLEAVDAGAVPTPALALAAMQAQAGAVMVTGSHIPADRNGLKFYVPQGEIAKSDETAILAALGQKWPVATPRGTKRMADAVVAEYLDRYRVGFGTQALAGLRIGIYQHSSVARDVLMAAIVELGAEPVPLARSDQFIPVDTEAVDPQTRTQLRQWCQDNRLDALISTDGDADRPMVTDAAGQIVPGDVLGALTAQFLGADLICTPISSNTMVDQMGFKQVQRTQIGSPFVIAAMETALAHTADIKTVGYEANGGFLLGFAAQGPKGILQPLATRDCLLPILAPLAQAQERGQSIADLVAGLPARFTAADRVQDVPTEKSQRLIATLTEDANARAAFFASVGQETELDLTDGLRVSFASNEIVHLRPSGNAPECRCYAEAGSAQRAQELVTAHLAQLVTQLT